MMTMTTRTDGKPSAALQEMELKDTLRVAERGVLHWDQELSARIGAAQALDGMGGWMSKLIGSYDDDVDAAVQKVAEARDQLARSKRGVEEARAALSAYLEGRTQAADDAVARVMEVEEAVARAKAAGGPAVAALAAVEARLALVDARRDRLQGAHEASLDLVMELSRARAAATRSQPHQVKDYMVVGSSKYGGHAAVPYQRTEGEYREVDIGTVTEVAYAWEEAMLALGVDAPPGVDMAMGALLQVDGHFADPGQSELATMAAQTAVEPMVRRLKSVLDEVQVEADGLQQQRAQAVGMELPDAPR